MKKTLQIIHSSGGQSNNYYSDKVKSSEKITVEREEIINEDRKNAEILNDFFFQMQLKI